MSAKAFLFAIVAGVMGGCAQMPGTPPLSPPPGAKVLACDTPAALAHCAIDSQRKEFHARGCSRGAIAQLDLSARPLAQCLLAAS